MKEIYKIWWPLAASWLLMGMEGPALSAVMARLQNPEINLAAYGGIVFPIALIIEAPVIMLLAASTTLSVGIKPYQKLSQFMVGSGALLTFIHILIAFTPLYDVVAVNIIGAPVEIREPGRLGLMLMTPWAWSIGYRRFNQGILIRYGMSRAVGTGTIIRLASGGIVLAIGLISGTIPGIVTATLAQSAGVISEAIYSGLQAKPIVRNILPMESESPHWDWKIFAEFYFPLALTSFLALVWLPIGSAALSRMSQPIYSLAVWPVLSGLLFLLRSVGFAYNEVVLSIMGKPNAYWVLQKFVIILTAITTFIHLGLAATPLSIFWFRDVSALPSHLLEMARIGLIIGIPLSGLTVLQHWYQGLIVYSKKTRGVPESMVIFLVVVVLVFLAGITWSQRPGLYTGMVAFVGGTFAQTVWLWYRSRESSDLVK